MQIFQSVAFFRGVFSSLICRLFFFSFIPIPIEACPMKIKSLSQLTQRNDHALRSGTYPLNSKINI